MIIEYEPPQTYRGVQIQNFQTRERIEQRVKPEIDRVMAITGIAELFRYCADVSCPPEARLLAGAMLEAIFNNAVDDRRERPDIDLKLVGAYLAGLHEGDSWRSPWSYGSLAGDCGPPYTHGEPRAEKRPVVLTDEQLFPGRR
jgi:hypothetical protein